MNVNHYIGFDVHRKSISYSVKTADGTIVEESTLRATLEVARKLVAYLLAVDKSGKPFQIRTPAATVEQHVQEVAAA